MVLDRIARKAQAAVLAAQQMTMGIYPLADRVGRISPASNRQMDGDTVCVDVAREENDQGRCEDIWRDNGGQG